MCFLLLPVVMFCLKSYLIKGVLNRGFGIQDLVYLPGGGGGGGGGGNITLKNQAWIQEVQ